jgi:hypothetical protein
VLCSELDEPSSLGEQHRARKHEEGLVALPDDHGERTVELVGASHLDPPKLQPERPGRRLRLLPHVFHGLFAECAAMPEDRHT